MSKALFPGYLPYDGDFDNPLREVGRPSFNTVSEFKTHGKESSILLSPTPVVTAEHVSSGGAEILSSPDTPSKPSLSVAPDIQPRSKCTTSNIVSFAEAPTMPEKTQRSTESNYPESNSSLKAFKASASNQSQKSGTSGLENDNFSTTAVRELSISSGSSDGEIDPATPADVAFINGVQEPRIQKEEFNDETSPVISGDHHTDLDKAKGLLGATFATSAVATAVADTTSQYNEHSNESARDTSNQDPISKSTQLENANDTSQKYQSKAMDKTHDQNTAENNKNLAAQTYDNNPVDSQTSESMAIPPSDQSLTDENAIHLQDAQNHDVNNKLHKDHDTNAHKKNRHHSVAFGDGINSTPFPKDQNENSAPPSPTQLNSARQRNKLRKKSGSHHRHHSSIFSFKSPDISPDEQQHQRFSLDETHTTNVSPKKKGLARLLEKFREK